MRASLSAMCDLLLPAYESAFLALYIGFYPPLILTNDAETWTERDHVFDTSPLVSVFQRGDYAVVDVDGVSTEFLGDVCDLYGKRVLPGAPLAPVNAPPLLTLNGQCMTSYGGGELRYGTTTVTHDGLDVLTVGNDNVTGYDAGYQVSRGPWGSWEVMNGSCTPRPLFNEGCLWWCESRPCQNGRFVYGDAVYYVCQGKEHSYAYDSAFTLTTLDLNAADCWGYAGTVRCGGFYGSVFGDVGSVEAHCDTTCELDFYVGDDLVQTRAVPVHRIDRVLVYGDSIFLFYDNTLVYGNVTWTQLQVKGKAFIEDLFIFVDVDTRVYDPRPLYGPCWRTFPGAYEYFQGKLFNSTHYMTLDWAGPCDTTTLLKFQPQLRERRAYEPVYTPERAFTFTRCDALEHIFLNESGQHCVTDVDECEEGYWLNTSANEDGASTEPCVLCVDCTPVNRTARPTLGSPGPLYCPAGQYLNSQRCLVCSDCWMTRRACGERDTECYTFTRDVYYVELFIGLQVVFFLAPFLR